MRTIETTYDEWEAFRELSERQMTPRRRYWARRWVAVFSTNSRGNEWSFANWGNTPLVRRKDLRGIEIVESLKTEYATVRNDGGRVFVNRKGAFYKTTTGVLVQFAVFRFPRATSEKAYYTPTILNAEHDG